MVGAGAGCEEIFSRIDGLHRWIKGLHGSARFPFATICNQLPGCHGKTKTLVAAIAIWVFPKIMVPQNGWFIMEIPIKMDNLGVPLFSETPIWITLLHLGQHFVCHH